MPSIRLQLKSCRLVSIHKSNPVKVRKTFQSFAFKSRSTRTATLRVWSFVVGGGHGSAWWLSAITGLMGTKRGSGGGRGAPLNAAAVELVSRLEKGQVRGGWMEADHLWDTMQEMAYGDSTRRAER